MKRNQFFINIGILLFLSLQIAVSQDNCLQVKSVDFIDENVGWVAGATRLLLTQDGGTTWSNNQFSGSTGRHNIDFWSSEIGWAARDTIILKTINGGDDWVIQKTFSEIPLGPGFPFVVNDAIVYVASDREVLKTSDGGLNWENIYLDMELTSLWFFDQKQGIVPGEGNDGNCIIKRTEDGGVTWESKIAPGIHEIYNLTFINDSVGFFIVRQEPGLHNPGPLYITFDQMNSWELILGNVVSYCATQYGTIYALVEDASGISIRKKRELHQEWETIWNEPGELRFIKFLDENTGWAIGDNLVLKTTDGGKVWIEIHGFAGTDFCDPNLFVGSRLLIQPDSIEAVSSKDGMIYLVPARTAQKPSTILSSAIDSTASVANVTAKIPVSATAQGPYWIYAIDSSKNISEPVEIIILMDTSNIVLMKDIEFLYALIDEGVDTSGDSLVSFEEAEAVTTLDVSAPYMCNDGWGGCYGTGNITSLQGIEAFTNLDTLDCSGNKINDTIDLTNSPFLKYLSCKKNFGGGIKGLNISTCTDLTFIDCQDNALEELNVSNNPALKELYCGGNSSLRDLDLSNNPSLESLGFYSCYLETLDLSNNLSLKDLKLDHSTLKTLDLSKNSALEYLSCSFSEIQVLDLKNNTSLKSLICEYAKLTSLDVSNNTSLTHLDCAGNQLSSLNVSGCTHLEFLRFADNTISNLDLSTNTSLKYLWCGGNLLTNLDISNNTDLMKLGCSGNRLTSLDVSNNTLLTHLGCQDNQLTNLDVSNNTELRELVISEMPSLIEVCVWETPFPPADVEIYTWNSPFVRYTTHCGSLNIIYPESFREIQEDLYRERPQIGNDTIRTTALIALDYLIGKNLEQPDPIQAFFDKMFTKALYEIRNEEVISGATVWQIYNHGFVVKTRTKTFGIDLTNLIRNEKFSELADLLDAYFISHSDGDHHNGELRLTMNGLGKPIIQPAEWSNQFGIGMEAGETLDINGLKVTAHYGLHGAPVRQFEITTPEGIKILHTGDNQTSETIPEVPDVNIFLLNAWVNESGAASSTVGVSNAIRKVNPDVCLLGHIQEYVNHGENAVKYSTVIAGDPPPEAHILAWGERYHFDDSSNDTICPNKVENLECSVVNDSLILSWETPQVSEDGERATFYRVKIDEIDDFFLSGTRYSIGWDSVRTYDFKVFSYDECGNQSKDNAEIDVELSADMNFSPRISSTYPFNRDTVDLFAGVYKVFWTESWDPNHDSLSYSWELDEEPIPDANSSEFHFDITSLDEGLHILSCIVSDQQVSVRKDWIIDFHSNMAIIDNEDVLMYSEQGDWQGQMLSTAHQLSCSWSKRENTKDWAQFVYYPQKSGIYDVHQMTPRTEYALNDAVYMIIMDNDVLDSVHIDQIEGCGDWVRIGQYFIEAGSEVKVIIINTGSATSGYALYVDAVKFEFLENVGIWEYAISDQLSSKDIAVKIYPNPAKEKLFIESTYKDNFDVEVIDVNGSRILHTIIRGTLCQIDLSSFKKGVYFITIRSQDIVTTRKIVKL